jgi:hypothetical protein
MHYMAACDEAERNPLVAVVAFDGADSAKNRCPRYWLKQMRREEDSNSFVEQKVLSSFVVLIFHNATVPTDTFCSRFKQYSCMAPRYDSMWSTMLLLKG